MLPSNNLSRVSANRRRRHLPTCQKSPIGGVNGSRCLIGHKNVGNEEKDGVENDDTVRY